MSEPRIAQRSPFEGPGCLLAHYIGRRGALNITIQVIDANIATV